ncbi:hypothetical protein R3I93_022221 [Phoxinus phoxinus]|uniref:Uncharacterized protein n=1 Tax=Phoxinus phoxinus TaxID=58324 RepID=A0AAN9GTY9_9TELE
MSALRLLGKKLLRAPLLSSALGRNGSVTMATASVSTVTAKRVEEDSHSCRATEVIHKALSVCAERQRSWCSALIVTLCHSPRHADGVNTAVFCCGDTLALREEK